MSLQKWIPSCVRLYSTFIWQRLDKWQWFPSLVSILHLPELRIFASQLLLEPPLIPKQNKLNTDKKLDFSTGRVFLQCDKSENTQLSNSNKIHFEQVSLVDTKLPNLRLLGSVNKIWLPLTARAYGRCLNRSNFLYKWPRNNYLRTNFCDWVLYLRTRLFKQWKKR